MKKILIALLITPVILTVLFFTSETHGQQARPPTPGVFTIFGTEYTGDGLAPGWQNKSLFNGVNTCNIIEKTQAYQGQHSFSCQANAPFEFSSILGPTPIDLNQYKYLTLYGKSTQVGQRYEIALVNADGRLIGAPLPLEGIGGPLMPDRWTVYNIDLTRFGVGAAAVHGIGFRDMNGAPQPKAFFDEIVLSGNPGAQPVISQGLGQPNVSTEPQKPKGPYYPQISPWVYIVPGIIILLAIFFE